MKRNLIYNCCALSHSEEWKLNVERLCEYPDAFNGRRLVIVKTGDGIADPNEVEASFAPLGGCEFARWENDPEIHEVAGFIETLAQLESLDPNEMTFYGHTKGVTYSNEPEEFMREVRRWRDQMYRALLSNIPRVEKTASTHPTIGCFRINDPKRSLLNRSWWFAGTFWWVRHDQLFARDWREIDRSSRFGIEVYPSTLFKHSESACLYGDAPDYNLYVGPGRFVCQACDNEFPGRRGPHNIHKPKRCPACHKHQGKFVRNEIPPGDA